MAVKSATITTQIQYCCIKINTQIPKKPKLKRKKKRKKDVQLENKAITNALQLEAARPTPVLFRLNYDAMPSLKSLNLSIVVL